ncbi:MAG TPA: DUF4398 domain-containing protein [Casimicrobiaceae bacterium]|nr:DUF4398 domain-containing protein [Casimicrobiaceae bacterium]
MTDSVASKRRLGRAATAVALAMLAGCATAPPAPTEQFAVGRAAVADAVSAGGAEFAPVALQSAQDKLDRANAAMAAGNYRDARRYAEDAEVDAKLAAATARSRKAERALAEVEAGIRTLREELARVSLR